MELHPVEPATSDAGLAAATDGSMPARTVGLRSYDTSKGPIDLTTYHSPVAVMGREAAADFLWLLLKTGDRAYADLYTGLCLADFSDLPRISAKDVVDWAPRVAPLIDAVRERHPLTAEQQTRLIKELGELHNELPTRRTGLREITLAFLGDCLFEEVSLFLAAKALKQGLLIRCKFVNSKNPIEQRKQLRALTADKPAALFFSPFTYAFHPDCTPLMEPRNGLLGPERVRELTGNVVQSTQKTIDFLAATFECPIFVSNASALQRGTSLPTLLAKQALSFRQRRQAQSLFNFWLPQALAAANERTFRHLFLLDEAAITKAAPNKLKLGTYLHTLSGLHPTRFSQVVADAVTERAVALSLLSRKIIVCDLDNTLWDGVIGEGHGVHHFTERQTILQRLKDKGVVLAIASKNDPAKIKWDGGVLDAASFVASEVSWGPKVQGIQRMFKDLNLKTKDGVFIDDRGDERAMVAERWPEMVVADPCDMRTWAIFAHWADLLDDEQEFDRTQMYQQREQRDAAMPAANDDAEAVEMFEKLGLKAHLRTPDVAGLKRVSELINRTNQWNLAASRTSFREAEQWQKSADHKILTVQVDDRFGSMGTVCVAVVRATPERLEIPVFVLSCRVFGYGVETLVLDYVKRSAIKKFGTPKVRGFFTATEHNDPCKAMYAEHGFVQRDGVWDYSGAAGEKTPPAWFTRSSFDV